MCKTRFDCQGMILNGFSKNDFWKKTLMLHEAFPPPSSWQMSLKNPCFFNPSLNMTAFEHRSCHVVWLWVAIEIVNILLHCLCRTTSYYADSTWDLLYFCFFLKIVFAVSINFQSHSSYLCHKNIRLRDWVYNA